MRSDLKASGQLFRDVEMFSKKFGLDLDLGKGHELSSELVKFRVTIMLEELLEYCAAVGAKLTVLSDNSTAVSVDGWFDPAQAFDALIDLVYVTLGTAYLHRFPFNDGWARVQEANMKKVRAKTSDESKRGSTFDVVKPPGWKPPTLSDLLD